MVPLMYTHLICCICVEICMACHQETYGTVGVIVYYSVQKRFLEAHLIDSCLSCVDAIAEWLGVVVTGACCEVFFVFFLEEWEAQSLL